MTEVIEVTQLQNTFGSIHVHQGLDLKVKQGEVLALVGGSGCGKSTLLRSMLRLQQPTAGSIKIYGEEITTLSAIALGKLRTKIGMMFQQGALFGSLTVWENVAFPLRLHARLQANLLNEIALLKIKMVGLSAQAASLYPCQLSGGMIKRAAVARAIALDPKIIFLDEPTAGLDPQAAQAMDQLIRFLSKTLQLTVVMVTHDLDTLWDCADRVAFLAEGKIQEIASLPTLLVSKNPLIQQYFANDRARRLKQIASMQVENGN